MRPDSIHEQDSASASHKLEAEVRELRETAFRYEDIIANMELGILEVDREECIVRAHPRFCEIVGYPESELIGKKASEVFLGASEDKGRMQERTRMRNEGKSGTYEVEIVTGTGEHKWLLISGVPRRNADGVVIGSMGIHQDITARKLVGDKLELVATDLRLLIDNANAPILGTDAHGRVNEWNNKAAEITGYTKQEVTGRYLVRDFIIDEYKVAVHGAPRR